MNPETLKLAREQDEYLQKIDELTLLLDKLRPGTGGAINFLLRDAYEQGQQSVARECAEIAQQLAEEYESKENFRAAAMARLVEVRIRRKFGVSEEGGDGQA